MGFFWGLISGFFTIVLCHSRLGGDVVSFAWQTLTAAVLPKRINDREYIEI
jgi:hypothetical protein